MINRFLDFTVVSLAILLCGSATFGTEIDYSPVKAPVAGICKTLVETQGYACEEHMVSGDNRRWVYSKLAEDSYGKIRANRWGSSTSPVTAWAANGRSDGITWLLNPQDQALAFVMADNGFDVWVANTRGTKYSRGHTYLSTDNPAYWDWSWDELVAYDLPATVQYVMHQAGQKLYYVGHSLGTLIALASFSKGKLIDMVRSAALLSPIAYLSQMSSPLAINAAENFIAETLYSVGIHEFDPRGNDVIELLKSLCLNPGLDCFDLLTTFTGQNCCLNSSTVQLFLEHEPQPTSTKNIIHLSQMIRGGGYIAMFNYSSEADNMKHYGQAKPPVYEMGEIAAKLPLLISYGGKDALSDSKDVGMLIQMLQKGGHKMVVQLNVDYGHADYVMGASARQDVYVHLISFFRSSMIQ